MKHKTYFLILVIMQAGCAVELRDRQQQEAVPPAEVTELKVDNEYTLPIPLIQSEQMVLRYDRLALGPKAQFITQGLNVRIEVKELIADDATLRTFKSDQIAAQGFNGRSGGHLELIAERATGHLTLVMQGEKGGMGAGGSDPNEALRGASGGKGWPAIFRRDDLSSILISRATSGSQGAQGLPGFPGGDGMKGGDSGTASIKITASEDFSLEIQKNPGHGGEGGPGGAGGPGGLGGEPGSESGGLTGDYDGPQPHYYTVSGPPGIQGPQGPTGNLGIEGYKEKSCIQASAESLRCE